MDRESALTRRILLTDISVMDISVPVIRPPEVTLLKHAALPPEFQPLLPLTPAVFYTLFSLADGEKHGYAIMQGTKSLSSGKFQMGPGTLYATLQRLLDLSLIEEVDGPPASTDRESRRRYYRLKGNGKLLLEAELARMDTAVRLAQRKKLATRTAE